ncbi:hypothetical protein C8R31_105214 [Nitrosospira sp. Nsp2]|nr:hypothetical protein C8R31_105214 [Nitrosospira sp. Nsp2]
MKLEGGAKAEFPQTGDYTGLPGFLRMNLAMRSENHSMASGSIYWS